MGKLKVSLSLEKTISNDVTIVVDALRASTTITIALDNFKKIIPAFSKQEAVKIAIKNDALLAGEQKGEKISGFIVGNSPVAIKDYKTASKILVLTTTNGVRILEVMESNVLIGSLINSNSVAKTAIKLAKSHIDVVMAGSKGHFAIEDYLVSGDIINSIEENFNLSDKFRELEITEYAEKASLESQDYEHLKKSILDSRAANKLNKLGYEEDVKFSIQKNISDNVGIYKNKEITLFK